MPSRFNWTLPHVASSPRTAQGTPTLAGISQSVVQGDTKKRELLKNTTKIEEIQEKKLLTEIEPLQLAF